MHPQPELSQTSLLLSYKLSFGAVKGLRYTLSTSIIANMNPAFHLYRLQTIDTQIDQAEASLSEIERLLSSDEVVNQAQANAQEADNALRQARDNLKQIEFSVHEQQMKIGESEAALYSGRIRSPKELQDLQKEIASLKKHLSVLEDQQLEAMITVEESESNVQVTKAALNQALADYAERSAGWQGQKEQLTRTLERLRTERSTALSLIPKEHLQIYEYLRKRKSGIAVTTISEGACSVCGTTIRPSELQAARAAQDLVYCSSCGRILYAG